MAEVVGPGVNREAGGGVDIADICRTLEYAQELEDVVRVAVAWHDAVASGRFDDIPTKQNRVLNALTGFQHRWPEEYQSLSSKRD